MLGEDGDEDSAVVFKHTVDGSLKSSVHQLRLVVYPIIYRVSYIPGGARFQPSTVLTVPFGNKNMSPPKNVCKDYFPVPKGWDILIFPLPWSEEDFWKPKRRDRYTIR